MTKRIVRTLFGQILTVFVVAAFRDNDDAVAAFFDFAGIRMVTLPDFEGFPTLKISVRFFAIVRVPLR